MSNQNNSDPLPYGKLDRTAKALAARLMGRIEVTYQHALGSLSEFWDMSGEPRALEALLAKGITEVVFTRSELIRRFRIASGKDVDPDDLVILNVCEAREKGQPPAEDLFRVKGMSRYFEPIMKRSKNLASASLGGQKSAETRRAKTGSAAPSQASNAGKKKKSAQGELDVPKAPREKSAQELAFDDYQMDRRHVLEQENATEFIEDLPCDREGKPTGKEYTVPYINAALAPLLKELEPLKSGDATGWERLTTLWWKDGWAAGRPIPFPFQALMAPKIHKKFIEQLKANT